MEVATNVPIGQFLEEWGDVLAEKVLKDISPVHNPLKPDQMVEKYDSRMERLTRKPFPSQAEIIKALAKGFYDLKERALICCGEMGTGKTLIGSVVAGISPIPQRTLIMCPPHLVKKWMREVSITIPGAIVESLTERDAITKLQFLRDHKAGKKPTSHEFYVVSRERAKASYFWKSAVNYYRTDNGYYRCPSCGGRITENEGDKGVFPVSLNKMENNKMFCQNIIGYRVNIGEDHDKKIIHRKVPVGYAAKDKEYLEPVLCKSALWSADNKLYRYAPAEYIKKYLNGYFDMAIFDECHELKGGASNQGIVLGMLASAVQRSLLLTGTLMGGYADDLFNLLFRIDPTGVKADGFEYGADTAWMRRYGTIEEVQVLDSEDSRTGRGKKKKNTIMKRRPGMSPLVLSKHLLDKTVFIRLSDVSEGLPPYDEYVVSLDMEGVQKDEYEQLVKELKEAIMKFGEPPMGLISKMLQSLLSYPDSCCVYNEEIWINNPKNFNLPELVASAPQLDIDVLPKEAELLNIIKEERSQGRRVLVYVNYTGTRDIQKRLLDKITSSGYRAMILSSTVNSGKREEWVADKVKEGVEVLICNPELVKTGLDLFEFPTIVFYQTGYVIPTLRQASRRSWRIGQTQPVKVYFLTYANTMQSTALSLIADKLETALMVEGELSDGGLAALSASHNTMLEDLTKALSNNKSLVGGAEDAWSRFRKKEVQSQLGLEDLRPAPLVTVVSIDDKIRTFKVQFIESKGRHKKTAHLEITQNLLNNLISERKGVAQFSLF